jgi:hypothetical protein
MVVAEENRVSRVRHVAGDISECILAAVMLMEGWMAVYIDRASKIIFFESKITFFVAQAR